MKDFVKVFQSETYGQIVIMRDYRQEDDKELVKFMVSVLGSVQELTAVTSSIEDADKLVDRVTLPDAEAAVKELVDLVNAAEDD